MASYQVLAAPTGNSFAGGFSDALGSGMKDATSAYAKAAMYKKLFTTKEDYKNANKKTDFAKLIPQIIAGTQDPSLLPDYNQRIKTDEQSVPGMIDMLDAGEKVTDENNVPVNDYGDRVRQSLLKEYYPGYSMDEVKRKAMGMPLDTLADKEAAKAGAKADNPEIPSAFIDDFKEAHDAANDNEQLFIRNLRGLAVKYADQPKVIEQIQRLIKLNSSKDGETDVLSD